MSLYSLKTNDSDAKNLRVTSGDINIRYRRKEIKRTFSKNLLFGIVKLFKAFKTNLNATKHIVVLKFKPQQFLKVQTEKFQKVY